MPQIFHPAMNTFSKVTIFGGLLLVVAIAVVWDRLNRSAYVTAADVIREQPVPFSHQHHVGGLGIDCRYCHTSVETSAFAGLPSTETCMTCHSQIWKDSPVLEPVRTSLKTSRPIAWTRVHDVPDFVYFNHSIHVAKGIGCESCHGRVDKMPLMHQAHSLLMSWCLDCHRHPAPHLRSPDEIYSFGTTSSERGMKLMKANGIDTAPLLDCGTCHR